MRNLLIVVALVCSSTIAHASSLFRLDLESSGVATAWVIDELENGFTWEAIAATNGVAEVDLGWSFHPTPALTMTAFAGATLEGERFGHAVPLFLLFYQKENLQAEWWNVGLIDPRQPGASMLYERAWVTWHHVGPFAEGTFPGNGVGQGVVGGIWTHSFGPADLQLSLGKGIGNRTGVSSRLTLVFQL